MWAYCHTTQSELSTPFGPEYLLILARVQLRVRSTQLTHISGVFAYSECAASMPMYGLSSFLYSKKGKKENLRLSLGVTRLLPIGLACCRGVLPQGQRRHNVSLSGCCTGHWQHVSHTMPRQLWAAALPFFLLSPVSGKNNQGRSARQTWGPRKKQSLQTLKKKKKRKHSHVH